MKNIKKSIEEKKENGWKKNPRWFNPMRGTSVNDTEFGSEELLEEINSQLEPDLTPDEEKYGFQQAIRSVTNGLLGMVSSGELELKPLLAVLKYRLGNYIDVPSQDRPTHAEIKAEAGLSEHRYRTTGEKLDEFLTENGFDTTLFGKG